MRDVMVRVSDQARAINIGSGFLSDYVLQIDQTSRAVAVCPG